MQFWRVSAKCGWQGWMRHLDTNSLKRCWSLLTMSPNPTSHNVDGKRRRLELLTTSSSPRSFGQLCQGRSEPWSGHRQGPCPPCRLLPCPRTVSRGSTLSPSACSCADSTFPSLCPHACADVAIHSILVATIDRECSCQGLPRGGCAGPHQCHGPGHGLAPSSIGWHKTGSCCRRSPSLQRCTTGD